MLNRRELLQAGACLPLTTLWLRSAAAASAGRHDDRFAVVDGHYDPRGVFAAQAQRSGVRLVRIDGDITALWLQYMEQRAALKQAQFIGLTSEQSLFCFALMARSEGLRLLQHSSIADGAMAPQLAWRAVALRPASTEALPARLGPALVERTPAAGCSWVIGRPQEALT